MGSLSNPGFGDFARVALGVSTGGLSEIGYAAKRASDGMETAARLPGEAMDKLLKQQQDMADKSIAAQAVIGPKASVVEPIDDRNKRLNALRAGMMSTLRTSSQGATSAPALTAPALTGIAVKSKLGA